jgi:myo-inositol-1(or 4)-monophosphatase
MGLRHCVKGALRRGFPRTCLTDAYRLAGKRVPAVKRPMTCSVLERLPELAAMAHRSAVAAGEMAMRHFNPGAATSARVWTKQGGSPVTEADTSVDAFLKVSCAMALPEAGWLSEETADDPARLTRSLVWVVDPIDGTRAFMAGVPDWCVCVALLLDNEPVLGVVHAPAIGMTYQAIAGQGATGNGMKIIASVPGKGAAPRLAGPKPMLDALAPGYPLEPQPRVPSLALRIARIADGSLHGGLVSADSRDWDLAAADLILREAGGLLTSLDGAKLRYNRERPVHATLVAAGQALHPGLLEAAAAMREASFGRR